MKAYIASCACLCLLLVSSMAPVASAGGGAASDPSVYGFWAKTLGGGHMLDHIFEAKQKLQQELELTRQTMLGESFRPTDRPIDLRNPSPSLLSPPTHY